MKAFARIILIITGLLLAAALLPAFVRGFIEMWVRLS